MARFEEQRNGYELYDNFILFWLSFLSSNTVFTHSFLSTIKFYKTLYLASIGGFHFRLQRHVGKGHLHGILDRVQQLYDHIGDVLEAEFPSLGGSEGGPDL